MLTKCQMSTYYNLRRLHDYCKLNPTYFSILQKICYVAYSIYTNCQSNLTQIQSIYKIVSSAQIICAPVNYLCFIMKTHNMKEQLTINTRYKTSHNNFIINVFCVNNTCTNCNINSFMDIGIVWQQIFKLD